MYGMIEDKYQQNTELSVVESLFTHNIYYIQKLLTRQKEVLARSFLYVFYLHTIYDSFDSIFNTF